MQTKNMKTIRVVAAVIRQNGKIFATQRGYGEWKDGWEFPGGKIESLDSVDWLPADKALIEKIRLML